MSIKLVVWEVISIYLNDEELNLLSKKAEVVNYLKINTIKIVYEDWGLFVVNKDVWINVHPWDHKTTEIDLISQVRDGYDSKLNSITFLLRLFIV